MGAKLAQGEILVFLDDDSYPSSNLLSVASPYFDNQGVVAIGGPAITPPTDGFWQKVSGAVFLSKFSGGYPERYLSIGKPKEIDDWPSVNFMVRREEFIQIGGFDSPYWPGEDTKLCLDLLQKTNKKILYVPHLLVWHHRRVGLQAHLKQIGAYGLHRGYFAKKHPQTSLKLVYFVPSALLLIVISSLFFQWLPEVLKIIIALGWALYGTALLLSMKDIAKHEAVKVAMCAIFYIFLTHLYYGFQFMRGLATSALVSKLR
jgi:GT2 family glycosyltransferase